MIKLELLSDLELLDGEHDMARHRHGVETKGFGGWLNRKFISKTKGHVGVKNGGT